MCNTSNDPESGPAPSKHQSRPVLVALWCLFVFVVSCTLTITALTSASANAEMLEVVEGVVILKGSVSNQYGRIGIRCSQDGYISHVYDQSPAHTSGLQVGDIVLDADGKKGIKYIDGMAGTTVQLRIKRPNGEVYVLPIQRVPPLEIFDFPDRQEVFIEVGVT